MAKLLLLIMLAAPMEAKIDGTRRYDVSLVDCYDGDTCTLDFQFSASVGMGIMTGVVLTGQKVRLCDVDTPEMRSTARHKVTEQERTQSIAIRDRLIQRLKDAKRVWAEIPQKSNCNPVVFTNCDRKGKYGRWLVYIYADDVLLNDWLADEGHEGKESLQCL